MDNTEKYLSIREFAELTGKTQQAIYQQLETRLKDYVKVIGNHKTINPVALHEVFHLNLTSNSSELDKDLKSELESKLNDLTSELTRLEKDLNNSVIENTIKAEKIKVLEFEKSALITQINELKQSKSDELQRITALFQEQIEELKTDKSNLNQQLAAKDKQIEQLNNSLDNLNLLLSQQQALHMKQLEAKPDQVLDAEEPQPKKKKFALFGRKDKK